MSEPADARGTEKYAELLEHKVTRGIHCHTLYLEISKALIDNAKNEGVEYLLEKAGSKHGLFMQKSDAESHTLKVISHGHVHHHEACFHIDKELNLFARAPRGQQHFPHPTEGCVLRWLGCAGSSCGERSYHEG